MLKQLMLLIMLLLIPAVSNAQTSVQPPSITTIMDGITADIGVGWDYKNKTWVETDTVRFLEYAKTDNTCKFKDFLNYVGAVDPRLSIGYSTANKLVVGGAFKLFVPSDWGITSPLLKYVSISPFAQYSFAHLGNVESQNKDSWIFGAYLIKAN